MAQHYFVVCIRSHGRRTREDGRRESAEVTRRKVDSFPLSGRLTPLFRLFIVQNREARILITRSIASSSVNLKTMMKTLSVKVNKSHCLLSLHRIRQTETHSHNNNGSIRRVYGRRHPISPKCSGNTARDTGSVTDRNGNADPKVTIQLLSHIGCTGTES